MPNIRNKKVVNQNDATTLLKMKGRITVVSVQTGSNNPAAAAFVVEASYNDGDDFVTPVQLTDPVTGLGVANVTGANKSGWARLGGADQVRARRTDNNVGNGDISMTVLDSDT